MSATGQTRRFERATLTSGLLPGADILTAGRHVSKVPGSDISLGGSARDGSVIFFTDILR